MLVFRVFRPHVIYFFLITRLQLPIRVLTFIFLGVKCREAFASGMFRLLASINRAFLMANGSERVHPTSFGFLNL